MNGVIERTFIMGYHELFPTGPEGVQSVTEGCGENLVEAII